MAVQINCVGRMNRKTREDKMFRVYLAYNKRIRQSSFAAHESYLTIEKAKS